MEPPMKKRKSMRNIDTWDVPASITAKNTHNPIRKLVDNMVLEPNPDKEMIALSVGDPTVHGNLELPDSMIKAVCKVVEGQKHNGYCASVGQEKARRAVARYESPPEHPITEKDVVFASGCSNALEMAIKVLADPGQNILLPRPGFSLYKTLAEAMGIKVKYYDLLPEKKWEVDLEHLASLIDVNTATIIINNPSNPCGCVYSQKHLKHIVDVAEEYKLPIIADEIYGHFVFPGIRYYSMASVSKNVPILSCGGLTKRFVVPGWRMGWVTIHDRQKIFEKEIRQGLTSLTQMIMGPNTIVQGAIEEILFNTPKAFFNKTINTVKKNADLCYQACSRIPGLKPVMPQGAMYMMVGFEVENFPGITSDTVFAEKLIQEQSVFCLPGRVFEYPNYLRLVLTLPEEKMREAISRIEEFCKAHYKNVTNGRKQ